MEKHQDHSSQTQTAEAPPPKKKKVVLVAKRPWWQKLLFRTAKWLLILLLFFVALMAGAVVGFGLIGGEEWRLALNIDTWRHIYLLVFGT